MAHKTAGHTRGCTTWTLRVPDRGRLFNVLIVGSWNVNPGYRLVEQAGQPASYPGIAADFQRTFRTLRRLPCDVFLGAHGSYFNLLGKLQRRTPESSVSVWVDPQAYQAAVRERGSAFQGELAQQGHSRGGSARLQLRRTIAR